MKKTLKWLAIGFGGLLYVSALSTVAFPAATATLVQLVLGSTLVSASNPLPVTAAGGTFTVTGFTPNGNYANLTATNSSASVALPAGTTVAFQNSGTTSVSCTLGIGSATASANQIQVPSGSTVFVTVGTNTFGACIDQSGSVSNVVVLAGGAGLGAGFGGGGSSGNGLVQTSPPSYSNGLSEPLTLNAQGALPAASLNLGAFTCSTLCSTTNRTLLSVNTFGYTTFSLQQTASDNSLLEVDVSYDGGTTWSQLPLETYFGQGATNGQGQFSSFVPTFSSGAVCARIPNPGGLVRVFTTAWNNGTFTVQAVLSNSDSCARPVTLANGGVVGISDFAGNNNIPPVVCGSAVSSCVLKNSSGLFYGVYANCTSACWLMVFNATAAPSNGATTSGIAAGNMVECIPIGAGSIGGVNYGSGPPASYSTGITATISSTACSTLTLSTVGFIHGTVR